MLVGSFLSSHAPDRYIRPAITFVIFASGMKYIGLGTVALGWVLSAVLLAGAVWTGYLRPWRNGAARRQPAGTVGPPGPPARSAATVSSDGQLSRGE